MASKANVEVNIGDVFQIPIDRDRVGYGQVVFKPEKPVLFVCIFAATTSPALEPDLAQIVQSDILLAGNTFDAKFLNGDWKIIGNHPSNLSSIALPVYRSGMGDSAIVETLDRSKHRAAKKEELNLPLRTYTAPVGFELALKAIAGVGKWAPAFNEMKYHLLEASSKVQV